jgi:hypothetical protein
MAVTTLATLGEVFGGRLPADFSWSELRVENRELRLSLLPHELLRLDDRSEAG